MTYYRPFPCCLLFFSVLLCSLSVWLQAQVIPASLSVLKVASIVHDDVKDSSQIAVAPIDPKIGKLLHGDTAKFNYAGSDLLVIDLEQPTPTKSIAVAQSIVPISVVADTARSVGIGEADKGRELQDAKVVGSKSVLAEMILPDTATQLHDTPDRETTTTGESGVGATPTQPTKVSLSKNGILGKSVVIKSQITRPTKTSASSTSYEASPAADIIGKNKLIQRQVVQYQGNDESKAAIYKARLSALQTIVPMSYNDIVQSFIEMYVTEKRDQVSRMLPRTDLYFRTFEEALDRHGLPMELKYLPVMESALIPHAKSQMGASGLWQLPYTVAKDYGLDSNDFIDERRDPKLSSEAAAMHLKNLYRKYLNWHLAIAAYHCGDGEMNKAIQRAGGIRDYWELATFLPIETQAYVPLFIAATYVMSYYNEHDIAKYEAPYTYYATDTVRLKGTSSLSKIAQQIDMELNELQFLNPAIIHDQIPASVKGYPLMLPANKIGVFVVYLNNLKNQKEITLDRRSEKGISLPAGNMWQYPTDAFGNKTSSVTTGKGSRTTKSGTSNKSASTDVIIANYIIQKGDNMKRILQMFPGVWEKDILRVNKLKDNNFRPGMTLKIPQSNSKLGK